MRRTLILIGVGQTGGGLVKLESIASSFRDMKQWADEQKFDQLFEISDLSGTPVYLKDISECIEKLDSSPRPPDQLVVYFNGHGLHNAGGDLWLLSKAPNQSSEAVNLFSSVFAAYYRNFKHVVLITDACRVPPTNLQFANVVGGSIFPNASTDGDSKAVDQFFAATLGDPALEVDLQNVPCSIYTLQLTEFLRGMEPALLEMMHAPDALPKVVRPRPLREALKTAVRARLIKNGYQQNTKPDAILSSDPGVWLSTFDQDPPYSSSSQLLRNVMTGLPNIGSADSGRTVHPIAPAVEPPPISRGIPEPQMAAESAPQAAPISLTRSAEFQVQLTTALRPDMETLYLYQQPQPWIPDGFHYETSCGFLLKGAESVQARLSGPGNVFSDQGSWVRFEINEPRLALVKLTDGSGFLLPAIPGHIGFIEFDRDSIQSIAYEPSANYGAGYERQFGRYATFSKNSRVIREVRDTFSSAASSGDLRLAVLSDAEMDDAMSVAAYSDEDVDLMLLVLLGYSCAASGKSEHLQALCEACLTRLGFLAFDLYLLAEAGPLRDRYRTGVRLLPPFPLAAQGWAMLPMAPHETQEELAGMHELTFASPWTLLKPDGVELCKRYIEEVPAAAMATASY